jgi:hypothetical protein
MIEPNQKYLFVFFSSPKRITVRVYKRADPPAKKCTVIAADVVMKNAYQCNYGDLNSEKYNHRAVYSDELHSCFAAEAYTTIIITIYMYVTIPSRLV